MSNRVNKELLDVERKIATTPDSAMLHLRHGVILGMSAKFQDALAAFERAVQLLPDYADAWACIGDAALAAGDIKRASEAFTRAYKIDPATSGALAGLRVTTGFFRLHLLRFTGWMKNLRLHHRDNATLAEARALLKKGYAAESIAVLRRKFGPSPRGIDACISLAAAHAKHGNHQAEFLLRTAVRRAPNNAAAHYNLGCHLLRKGERESGIAELQRARSLDADDASGAALMLGQLGEGEMPQRVSPAIIQTLFDDYADIFDQHLVGRLEYRVPQLVERHLAKLEKSWPRMLDLGCGTGLCGVAMRAHGKYLAGVDLSQAMLEKARERGCYDSLHAADCIEYLNAAAEQFDLIVAADVLVYLGELSPLFKCVKEKLSANGDFWFTVESTGGDRFTLAKGGRFQHSLRYLKAATAAAGLSVVVAEDIRVRLEGDRATPGLFVIVRHGLQEDWAL